MKSSGEVKTLFNSNSSDKEKAEQAAIARMGEVDAFSHDQLDRMKIIYPGMSNLKMLNIFRELRTQLMQVNKKKNFVCMVSSISHGGGASYMATNLAAVFALDKTKTSLLIDANLYSPSLHELVIGDSSNGVTDYLSNPAIQVKDVVYATGIPRLRVIPIGGNSEAAAEYFSSDKMLGFVDEIRSRYPDRYIFVDAPPINDSSEARILSEIADMVLLVVPHGGATMDEIDAAIEIVGKEKLSGLVYNN